MRMSLADIQAHEARVAESKAAYRGVKPEKPLLKASACDEESVLHDKIINHCRTHGWLYFHGSMAHATKRTRGEPDFILLIPGRVLFIEAKSSTGKLSHDQRHVIGMAERLGHKIHIVRSYSEFLELVKQPEPPKDLIP